MTESSSSPIRAVGRRILLAMQRRFPLRPRSFCLITGAPRSGTTAVARWLSNHRSATGLNESRILIGAHRLVADVRRFDDLNRHQAALLRSVRRLTYNYYTDVGVLYTSRLLFDKEPLEPMAFPDRDYAGFLEDTRVLFPQIRLLFMVRDPLATIWSMTQRKWGYSLTQTKPVELSLDDHIENWCACAELALRYRDDPNVLLCRYDDLIREPTRESRRIFDFLDVEEGAPFEPRPTKEIGFSGEERELIVRAAEKYLDMLGMTATA